MRVWGVIVMLAACSGDKQAASAVGSASGSGSSQQAPTDLDKEASRALVDAEAAWQRFAKEGPPDAFCNGAKDLATKLGEIEAHHAHDDPPWSAARYANLAHVTFERLDTARCADAKQRIGVAAMAHILLAHVVTLTPLPYDVPPELVQKVEGMFASPTGAPPQNLKEAVRQLSSDADAICACQDKTCLEDAQAKLVRDALAATQGNMVGSEADRDKVREIRERAHKCAEAMHEKH